MNTEKYMNDETNEFPLAYFSFASSKDPDWEKNYPNTATMEVIVPTNFNNYAKWEDGKWKKEVVNTKILKHNSPIELYQL